MAVSMSTMFARLVQLKHHAPLMAVVAAGLVALAGGILMLLAMRPSRFGIQPGEFLYYRITVESSELVEGGAARIPRAEQREMLVVGAGEDNQALLAVAQGAQVTVALVSIGTDGQVRTCDAAGRRSESGVPVGWFDLSLCALPPGSEQVWDKADLVYAALPPQRRVVQAKVRRLRSGASPEFQLKLPASIEWINRAGLYEQVRDAVCTYRFANGKHAVERAELKLVSGEELPNGRRRTRWRYEATLAGRGRLDDEVRAIRDLALTGSAIQEVVAEGRRDRLPALVARLGGIDVSDQRLREIARRLAERARMPGPAITAETMHRPPAVTVTAPARWEVVVGTVAVERKPEADQLMRRLARKGLKAYVAPAAQGVAVVVGPYERRDQAVLGALAEILPDRRLAWTAVKP